MISTVFLIQKSIYLYKQFLQGFNHKNDWIIHFLNMTFIRLSNACKPAKSNFYLPHVTAQLLLQNNKQPNLAENYPIKHQWSHSSVFSVCMSVKYLFVFPAVNYEWQPHVATAQLQDHVFTAGHWDTDTADVTVLAVDWLNLVWWAICCLIFIFSTYRQEDESPPLFTWQLSS